MTITEFGLLATTLVAIVGAAAAIIRDRRKPALDLVNAEQVRIEVKKMSDELNAARDLRVLDLEKWADKMRPVVWKIKERDDAMCGLIRAAYEKLGWENPNIPEFPDIPEFPAPRNGK